ncbi:MAG: lipopolysaccharide biosynthesis protein, partial [Dehalococcoidia bacterium]
MTSMLSLLRVGDGSRLFANAFYLWLSFIAPSASGFFFWVVAARLYSAEAVGVGAAAFSAIVILSEVAHLGMGFGLVRWLPALNNKDAARLINSAFTLGGIVSLGVFLIFLFGVELLAPPLRILRQQPAYFLFFLALAPWAVLYPLLGHTFLAFRDARYTLLQNLVATMVRIGLVVALASYLPSFGVIAAAGAGVVVGVGLGFAYSLRRLLPGYRPRLALPDGSLRQLLPYSFGNYLSNLLLWAPTYVMPILAVNRL